MIKSFLAGAAVGAATVYLCDPDKGAARRQRVMSLWEANRDDVHAAARTTGAVLQTAANTTSGAVNTAAEAVKAVRTSGPEK
jgi:gas vesicle protein